MCDFAAVSIVLYYTLGIIAEVSQPVQLGELIPIFGHSEPTACISLALIAVAPWVLRLGSMVTTPQYTGILTSTKLLLPSRTRKRFYFAALIICTVVAAQSLRGLLTADILWTLQADTLAAWGPFILWFYIPSALLVLFVASTDVRSTNDKLICVFMVVTSICATVTLCERTLMLIPILVVFLFARSITIKRLVFVPAAALLLATVMLPVFKPSFANDDRSFTDLTFALIHGDISRAGVLAHAVDRSEAVGTRTLSYPMSGYVYAVAFFVPRSIAPWKGQSTAQEFTAAMSDTKLIDTDWGYGVGLIEETVLNAGIVFSIPILFCYGLLFGCLDKLKSPALIVPLRLGTLWIAGYHLTALMQTFGPAIIVASAFLCLTRTRFSRLQVPGAQASTRISAQWPQTRPTLFI